MCLDITNDLDLPYLHSYRETYQKFDIQKSKPVTIMRNGELVMNNTRLGFLVLSDRLSYTSIGAPRALQKSAKSNNDMQKNRKLFFMTLKRQPELYNILKNFIATFQDNPPPVSQRSDIVFTFIEDFKATILDYDPWRNVGDDDLSDISEHLEKYIMTLLFKICFSPTTEDHEKDRTLFRRFNALQFIEPKHLDIVPSHVNEELINLAVVQLRKINEYKSPKDKLVCVFNCCTIIYTILNKAYLSGEPAGADEFLPILIYVTLKANPPQLHSNIQYISNFRNPDKMSTELGYYFIQLSSAVTFIENVDSEKLTISKEEFDQKTKNQIVVNTPERIVKEKSKPVDMILPSNALLHLDTIGGSYDCSSVQSSPGDLLTMSYADFFMPTSLGDNKK